MKESQMIVVDPCTGERLPMEAMPAAPMAGMVRALVGIGEEEGVDVVRAKRDACGLDVRPIYNLAVWILENYTKKGGR